MLDKPVMADVSVVRSPDDGLRVPSLSFSGS